MRRKSITYMADAEILYTRVRWLHFTFHEGAMARPDE